MAVAFLHNCGLVNADIKPDNLLLCNPPGQILPFFLASLLPSTRQRHAVSTPASPEARWLTGCCPAPTPPAARSPPHPAGSQSVALRLVDFGGCFSLTETDTQAVACEVQTLPYRAPEVS